MLCHHISKEAGDGQSSLPESAFRTLASWNKPTKKNMGEASGLVRVGHHSSLANSEEGGRAKERRNLKRKRLESPYSSQKPHPRSPGAYRRLQQRAEPRHEEDGRDELALGAVVVPDAERLGQDQRDGDDATKGQDVVLRVGR